MRKHESMQQPQKAKPETPTKISRLLNSIYYFLDCVFILLTEKDYRLVILHHDKVVMDSQYKTLRGAKIAYAKFFNENAWAEGVQPQWSQVYQPDDDWLSEKLEILKKKRRRKGIDR
jgi:hypothetical protein